jgi:CubicO group peptidase (beta-lactamase class C family)
MSKPFTPADAERLRTAARETLAEFHLPGVAIGVVAGQDLVFAEAFGFADIESGRPQNPALRQRIGSITKTMVSLCAMALVDEGRLSLSERLTDHIPELAFHGDGSGVTVRHLLTHTAGIGEVAMPDDVHDTVASLWSDAPDHDVLGLFPKGLTIDVEPGTKWSYANLGFALLGEIVSRIEGAPIAEVVQRRVFAPLGMANSDLLDLPRPDLTTGYHRAPGEDERELMARVGDVPPDEPTVDGHNIRGRFQHVRGGGAAGAVQSTVPDMARYAAALLRGGGGIVRPETFAAMIAPQWEPDARLESWGLGFQRFERFGRRVFGHGGGVLGGWNSMLHVLPEEDLALIIHCNAYAYEGFAKLESRLLAVLLDGKGPQLAGTLAPEVLAAAPGVYEAIPGRLTNFRVNGGMGRLLIKAEGGGLRLYSRRGPWKSGVAMHPADPADPGFFHLADDALEPSRLSLLVGDGQVMGLRCDRLVEMARTDQVPAWA